MDALGLSSAVLLRSSSGGYVAQQVAANHPRRVAGPVLVGSPRSLQGRPRFADDVDQLSDPVDAARVRPTLAGFRLLHETPASDIDDRVHGGARIPAHVWRETFNGLCEAPPPTVTATITSPTLII